mmetsp:Transcript_66959/g.131991  ORF Transcript_66959/g.131991 Transcript_66959/m.131991 type:complete len:491 (+) Transcript_66959:70-1542(+)
MFTCTKESMESFMAITNAKQEEAERFLELTQGNLTAAVGLYMDAGGPAANVDSQNQASHLATANEEHVHLTVSKGKVIIHSTAAQGSPTTGVAQPVEKTERRRQRQARAAGDTAMGDAFANVHDDPFGSLGPEAAPFATAPASHGRHNWTAACESGWPPGGDSSLWPTAAVTQPPAVHSRAVGASEPAIQVNSAPMTSARRRTAPRFDDTILDALQDLPSNSLAAMLHRLAQRRPAEFLEAFGQRAPTAGAWPASSAATSAKSPWCAGATADPATMVRQNSGLDSWPATKPGVSPRPKRATPLTSPALPAASARAPGTSPQSQALTPMWDHPTAATAVEATGSPPSASASAVEQASLRSGPGPEWPSSSSAPGVPPANNNVTGWPVPSSPATPLASSTSPAPPPTAGAAGSWLVPNSPALAVAAAAAAAEPSSGMGPGVVAESAAVPDPWGEASATAERTAVKSPWPEAAAPAPNFAWPMANDAWPAQAG